MQTFTHSHMTLPALALLSGCNQVPSPTLGPKAVAGAGCPRHRKHAWQPNYFSSHPCVPYHCRPDIFVPQAETDSGSLASHLAISSVCPSGHNDGNRRQSRDCDTYFQSFVSAT